MEMCRNPLLAISSNVISGRFSQQRINGVTLYQNGPVTFYGVGTSFQIRNNLFSDPNYNPYPGPVFVVGVSEELVRQLSANCSDLYLQLSHQKGWLKDFFSRFVTMINPTDVTNLAVEEVQLLEELSFLQENCSKCKRDIIRVKAALNGIKVARVFLFELDAVTKALSPDQGGGSPQCDSLLCNAERIFAAAAKQRLDLLSHRYPVLLQATMQRV